MMHTTLEQIRVTLPCGEGWEILLKGLGKTEADDEPLLLSTILDINGLDDALLVWDKSVIGYKKERMSYALWCACQVKHLMTDRRSIDALNVVEKYINGQATEEELAAARDAAWSAAWSAAYNARSRAARAATRAAARSVATAAVNTVVWSVATAAVNAVVWDAAKVKMRQKQEQKLREVLKELEA